MKILITGGAGYIGSHTVKELIRQGYQVLVYDNLSYGHKQAVHPKAELVVGDISDEGKLSQTFKKFQPEAVIHFAGFIIVPESVRNPAKYFYNNFCFGVNLLEVIKNTNVKYIIYSSSAGLYGNPEKVPIKEDDPKEPIHTYGLTKLIFEKALGSYEQAYGLKYIALRYFNAAGASKDGEIGEHHQPETHIIPLIIKTALGQQPEFKIFGGDYSTPDGSCIRDYIHVEDLATAHLLALEYLQKTERSDVFNLGLGKGFSNKELVEAVKKVSGKDFKVVIGSPRPGDPTRLVADSSKAQRILNWQAKYDKIEDIIETAWRWHKSHPDGFEN